MPEIKKHHQQSAACHQSSFWFRRNLSPTVSVDRGGSRSSFNLAARFHCKEETTTSRFALSIIFNFQRGLYHQHVAGACLHLQTGTALRIVPIYMIVQQRQVPRHKNRTSQPPLSSYQTGYDVLHLLRELQYPTDSAFSPRTLFFQYISNTTLRYSTFLAIAFSATKNERRKAAGLPC